MVNNFIIPQTVLAASRASGLITDGKPFIPKVGIRELIEKAREIKRAVRDFIRSSRSVVEGDTAKCDPDNELHIQAVKEGDEIVSRDPKGDHKRDNRYEIIQLIGSGNMANVFLARNKRTGEEVAIKVMFGASQEEVLVRRFSREAAALATLSHPNIVNARDVGWDKDKQLPFIVMENLAYVPASQGNLKPVSFKLLMRQFHEQKIDMATMLYYFADVCDGLYYLHDRVNPVIHRDLKPDNILISNEFVFDKGPTRNLVKLSDFGLVRILGDHAATTLTKIGSVEGIMGSPGYAAIPDMYNDEYRVTHKSDLYSVGIMLYELISGRLPYSSDRENQNGRNPLEKKSPYNLESNPKRLSGFIERGIDLEKTEAYHKDESGIQKLRKVIKRHLEEQPDFSGNSINLDVDPELVALIKELLEKNPDNRPRDAATVSERLRSIAKKMSQVKAAYPLPNLTVMNPQFTS